VAPLFYNRLYISLAILVLAYVNTIYDLKTIRFLRYALVGGLLIYWYPETFDLNRYLPNRDYILANWDQLLFGFQPAFVFSKIFPQIWFSELMNMGYFAYYFLIIGSSLFFYFKNRTYFKKYVFCILFSFFVFYLIFIFFPTSGPQYYFSVIGAQNVEAGIFPYIGDYFNVHPSPTLQDVSKGFFNQLVKITQEVGERPTAAFPSSHVGISTLIMIMVIRERHYLMAGSMSVFYIFLVLATVYVQAHFVIDAIVGFIFAFVLYGLSYSVYAFLKRRENKIIEYKKIQL
jgi:membrane-associated phospholipid phosphatase